MVGNMLRAGRFRPMRIRADVVHSTEQLQVTVLAHAGIAQALYCLRPFRDALMVFIDQTVLCFAGHDSSPRTVNEYTPL
jgi:hypothetical protein